MYSKLRFLIRRKYWTYRVRRAIGGSLGILFANGPTYLTRDTFLGSNVHFNGLRVVGRGRCDIGNNFHSGSGCIIFTHYHNFDGGAAIPYDNSYIVENVVIKDNVWIGINVIILAGVTIGEGAIIQAGSVVVNNIPDLAIAGGHPARVFKYRNKDHYFKLVHEQRYF
ncbi:acyltransferase [Algoriphagus terrigena]|uniref:acyltransferase n=1 Tax=Algoriphagus terrigena TaxID=344884 RepID=UPI00047C1E8A|nr:acyltransferase [Algoriphagus terrigena]